MTKRQYVNRFSEMYELTEHIINYYEKGGVSKSKDWYLGFSEAIYYCLKYIKNDMEYSTNNEQDEIGE